ncbi:MAG: transcription termination factor NusA [Pseudomonadota bacterium]
MVTTATINVHELLQVADAVSREKGVERQIVVEALQDAIARSAKQRYGAEYDIRVTIQPKDGDIIIRRYREIVEEIDTEAEHPAYFITLQDAKERDDGAQAEIGEFVIDELPSVEIGRISAQSARQVIVQKIREAERQSQYEAYKDRVGEIIYGTIKRVEFGNVMISLGEYGEGIIRRNEVIPRENIKVGDRIRCYIYDVRQENNGPQVFLSRTHPQFLACLFASEVPEIYDGVIEIKAVARDPGSRAKIAVYTDDPGIDPVGSCVGLRGGRVQAVMNELQGEKIDIIEWSPDAATFIMSALSPTPVLRVVVDDEFNKVEVVVPDDSLSQVIGRRGQNVRLLSHLLGWDVDVVTETDDSTKRQREFTERTDLFVKELDVDVMLAQFLASEGFANIEDVAYTDPEEFENIEGLDSSIATELQERAYGAIERKKIATLDQLGVSKTLREMQGLTTDMLLDLAKHNIKSLEDFAGLTADELVIIPSETPVDEAQEDPEAESEALDDAENGVTTEAAVEEEPPYLAGYPLEVDQVNKMIIAARKAMGWIS